MGSLAKAISQLSSFAASARLSGSQAPSSQSILSASSANKQGLSFLLDSTLKTGHDMKTFGLGTAATMSSVERYARFTHSMLLIYTSMEDALDKSTSRPVRLVWDQYGDDLKRGDKLRLDLNDVMRSEGANMTASVATMRYCDSIKAAAQMDDSDGGGRLIGHLYCRYFADLFGGQMLSAPTRYALAPDVLPGTPRHYDFGKFGEDRKESIEELYKSFNAAGDTLSSDSHKEIVKHTLMAFEHNINVYSEEGNLWTGAAIGVKNVVIGFTRDKILTGKAGRP